MDGCIFCKIVDRSISSEIIYEDNDMLAFKDINPKADVHFLLIPKLHIDSMRELSEIHTNLIAKMVLMANKLALEHGLGDGYKFHINTGVNGGQEVFHWHIHIYGNLS